MRITLRDVLRIVNVLCLMVCVSTRVEAAPTTYAFDTSPLIGLGDVGFDVLLIDGDGVSSTMMMLDLFDFGGGSVVGLPTLAGGATGSLAGTVGLSDTAFLNSFTQRFTPGSILSFRLDFSTTASGVPQPDGFQFSLLDAGGAPLTTTDPSGLNALILGELSVVGSTFEEQSLTATSVPEPSTLASLAVGVGALLRRRTRQRSGAGHTRAPR